jgi:cell division protein FtsB
MKWGKRLLVSLYIGFVIYSLLVLVWGPSGYVSLKSLNNYKYKLQQNNRELVDLHEKLRTQLESLKYDSELIRLYARSLGYFDDDEQVIRVENYSNQRNFYSVGRMIRHKQTNSDLRPLFRTFSCAAVIIVFFLFGMVKRKEHGNKKG